MFPFTVIMFFGVSIEFNVDGPGTLSGSSPFVLLRRFPSNVCFVRFTLALIVFRRVVYLQFHLRHQFYLDMFFSWLQHFLVM